MKKLYVLSLFAFLCFQLSVAQYNYDKNWEKVEKLEVNGKLASANRVVKRIYDNAEKEQNAAQIVKSFIYKTKFALLITENSEVTVLQNLQREIDKQSFPINAILENVYAKFLSQYFNKHQYNIRDRSIVASDSIPSDFRLWDTKIFVTEIHKRFQHSILLEKSLLQLPVEDYMLLLDGKATTKKYRSSLYDILVYNSLDFYKTNIPYRYRRNDKYTFKQEDFAPTSTFIKREFHVDDEDIIARTNTLQLFQKLETVYQNNKEAHVDIVLQRLQFALTNSEKNESNEWYEKALQKLAKRYENGPLEALIKYELAMHYVNSSKKYYTRSQDKDQNLRVNALAIAEKIIAQYPNSEGSIKCQILKKRIEQKSLEFKTQEYSSANKPLLSRVSLRNVDTLHLKIYRISHTFLYNGKYDKRDSIVAAYIKGNKPVLEKSYNTKIPKGYYDHSIEISIPKLPIGRYLVTLSDGIHNKKASEVFAYDMIQKTNLSEIITELNDVKMHTIVHRETGEPIFNATIKVFDKKNFINQRIQTDILGNAKIRKRNGNRTTQKYIIYKNDTLYKNNTSLGYEHSTIKGEPENWEAKPFIFTDRSIYRPGQTVHFKVILIQQKNGISSVVPNVYCEVSIESKDSDLKTLRLKTNEFGAFSHSFKIPKNIATGRLTIIVDEDDDYKEKEHPFWDFVHDFEEAEADFQVEEYKRPRFEVLMNPLKENITFNDSVKVTGKAKALLGSSVTNAKVSYTIKRQANIDYKKYKKYRKLSKTKIITEGTVQTDVKGNFTIPFTAETDVNIEKEDIRSYNYDVSIEVTDINGETQVASKSVTVAKKGFNLRVMVPIKKDRNDPFQINIAAEDANYVPVTTNGRVKIYKRINTARILTRRPWHFPELQIISKETFIKQFPHTLYDQKEKQENNKKGAEVANMTFNTKTNAKLSLDTSSWETGTYTMETYAFDEKTKDTIRNTETFWLTDPKDVYATGNTLFEYTVLNSAYKNDGFIKLKLSTALREDNLNVLLYMFHKETLVHTQLVIIDKGSKTVKIPLDKKYTEEITVRMMYTKFNHFYKDRFSFKQYEENKLLSIETTTFRNKLQSGQKETWRFKIFNLEQKGSNAEVLASMYDESLDQFRPHAWNTDFNYFYNNRYYTPHVESTFFGNTQSSEIYNLSTHFITPKFRDYLRFKWFGLNFDNLHSANHTYTQRLKREKAIKDKSVFTGNITGHIFDDSGMPLPGATILIKGTDKGVTTDFDGLYSINATSNDILAISYVGFITKEIVVGNKKNINATLESGNQLEAVTIVGYGGAVNSAKISSAVTTIDGKSLNSVPIGTLDQMLQGYASGISINTGNGQSGDSGFIVIRGRASLKGDIEPLFVIDGVPVSQNAFRNMNSENITSLSVLKDLEATALYGSRGAGGVIIVSTKYGTRTETINGMEVTVGLTEEDINTVETRKDLKETAFFYPHLRTDAEGNVAVEFEAPESLTRWKFQLLAHQKNGMYGSIEKNAVTQKELMVVPNMPRFLREKDTIVISTKVVNLQNKTTKGIASLRLFDATTMESIDAKIHLTKKSKAFTIDAKGNTNVSWKLYIPEGFDAIQYKVIAKADNFSDGEESALPVLKNSILITEAKPIWVKAGEEKKVTFNKLANNTSTSLKQHKLTLEYTSNPTWSAIQSLPYLIEYPYECAEQTFSRLYANMIAAHILQRSPKVKEVFESWKANGQLVSDLEKNQELKTLLISETPWIRDAISDAEKKQRLAKLFDSKAMEDMQLEMWIKLENMQKVSGGFPWFAGGNENLYITLHMLQTYAHLVKLGIITTKNPKGSYNVMKKAFKYIDTRFLIAHANLLEKPNNNAYRQQVSYVYTRTMISEVMKIPKDVKKAIEFYLEALRKDWILLSIEEKAMVALSLARIGKRKDAKKIMESLEESAVRSAENGMYWKEITDRRYYNAHAIETQALLIEAFSEITKDKKIVQELQLWLLQQKQTSQWATTKATTKAIYALLLNPKEFVSIKDNTVFTMGTENIKTKKLDETAKEAGTGYFKTSWNKDEVSKEKATITIKNNGEMAGYGAAYWQYFEELDQIIQNDEASLQVSKELYLKDTNNVLVPIENRSLKIGDLITVRLTIKNKKDIEFIHLKDMRAAGLEPVNMMSQYKWQDGVGYFESTRDASTNFFFDRIPKGVFILEYELRVNNIGEFSNGVTTIESMYAPEYRSHSKSVRIKIHAE